MVWNVAAFCCSAVAGKNDDGHGGATQGIGPAPRKERGYTNKVNRLSERRLDITDGAGKPATSGQPKKAIGPGRLEIVWTDPEQYGWNYCLPELHGGKGITETDFPSLLVFFEKKLNAKDIIDVAIPDTPYRFFILDGKVTPFFWDSEKDVIWHMNGTDLNKAIRGMRSISVSSKKIRFSAGGGDMAAHAIVDFSDRDNSPRVQYIERFHGP
jgi:hypothetical protein